ncbi:MAG TPA: hypothetical protein VJ731_13050 [Terriglobales bacterium]|nr:hypothetical protein [Terriglobales bacterium]
MCPHSWSQSDVASRFLAVSCAAGNCDRADFGDERLQKFVGGSHPGEVAGIGDENQFLFRRLHAVVIVNGCLRGRDDIVLALDTKNAVSILPAAFGRLVAYWSGWSFSPATCNICIKEALLADRMHREGKSAEEIRAAIIHGDWANVTASTEATSSNINR